MNPGLSRRVARAVHRLDDGALTLQQRLDLGPACEGVPTFEALPGWVQRLVREGERQPR